VDCGIEGGRVVDGRVQCVLTGELLADFRHFELFCELVKLSFSNSAQRGLPKLSSKGFKLDLTLGQLPQAINSIFDCTVCSQACNQAKTEFIASGGWPRLSR
jgi:hypothetical protein